MRWRLGAAAAVGVVALAIGPPAVALDDVIVSGDEIEATESDDGGWTAKAVITNTGEDELDLAFTVAAADRPSGCAITSDPEAIEARWSGTVEIVIPEGCGDDAAPDLALTAGPGEAATLVVTTADADEPFDLSPIVGGYGPGFSIALIVIFGAWIWARPGPTTMLPGLAKDWDFTKSWAANVGLAGAVFTGVLGTGDVLKEVLGDGSEGAVALAVVSAAMTAGLIGAAPLALAVLRKKCAVADGCPEPTRLATVGGFLTAMFVVVWATTGQVLAMRHLLVRGDQIDDAIVNGTVALALAGLAIYGVVHGAMTMKDGAEPAAATAAVI